MSHPLAALAWNGFREARRNRITVVLVLFAVALVFGSVLLTEASVAAFQRVLVDLGLGSMSIAMVLLAVFLSTTVVTREIERRTIFLMVSKPISRTQFVIGRLAGNMIAVTALLAGMAAIFAAELWLYGMSFRQPYFVAIVGLWFELLLISCAGLALSSFSGQITASAVTLALYWAGHLSEDLYSIASQSKTALLRTVGRAAYYALPNLTRLNFRDAATYDATVPWSTLGASLLYAVAYSGALLAIGVMVFNRRDFK